MGQEDFDDDDDSHQDGDIGGPPERSPSPDDRLHLEQPSHQNGTQCELVPAPQKVSL